MNLTSENRNDEWQSKASQIDCFDDREIGDPSRLVHKSNINSNCLISTS